MKKAKTKLKVRNSVEAANLLIPQFTLVAAKWRPEVKNLGAQYPQLKEYLRLQWRLFTLLGRMATMGHMPWLQSLVDEFNKSLKEDLTHLRKT